MPAAIQKAPRPARELKSGRLELRVTPSAKKIIQRAMAVTGLAAGDLAYEGARRLLEEQERMVLIGEDAVWFSHDGDSGSTSTNLLLGVQTSTQARTARNGRVTTVTTRERLPRHSLVRMEEIATRE